MMHVVVVGGGIAGAEALLALRELAGERVELTLVTDSDELVVPPLSVAEPFALGHAPRHPLGPLLERSRARLQAGRLVSIDDEAREIALESGERLSYEALLLAPGAKPVARVEHATTWWPRGDTEPFSGLLRDLEEGYTKRVAFVIPAGAVWPLPLYELALMTAREVRSMGIDDTELTVITPEAVPLLLFGARAAAAVRDELQAAGVRLETASLARVDREARLQVVLQPSTRRLDVDRVVAIPGVEGPAIPGTAHDSNGFIQVERGGRMRGSETVWVAGDAVAYPVKYGGIAAQQADAAAADIATRAGVASEGATFRPRIRGVLLTGSTPRPLGGGDAGQAAQAPMWKPTGKVFGTYLTPFLEELGGGATVPAAQDGQTTEVDEPLPEPTLHDSETFHALWRPEYAGQDYLKELGTKMHDYEERQERTAELLAEHGQLRRG